MRSRPYLGHTGTGHRRARRRRVDQRGRRRAPAPTRCSRAPGPRPRSATRRAGLNSLDPVLVPTPAGGVESRRDAVHAQGGRAHLHLAAWSIRLPTRQAGARAEATSRERRIVRPRTPARADRVDRGRVPTSPVRRLRGRPPRGCQAPNTRCPSQEPSTASTRPTRTVTDWRQGGRPTRHVRHELGHGAAGGASAGGARSCAGCAVTASDGAGGQRMISRTGLADRVAGTAVAVSAGHADCASRASAVRRLIARRYFLR